MLFSSTVSRIRQRLAALSGKSPSLPARRLRGLRLFLEPLEDRTVPSALSQTQLLQNYGQVRLNFEINQGQTDPQVNFLSHGPGYGLFLTPTKAVLSLQKPSTPVASTPSAFTGQPGALVVPPLGGLVLPPEGGTTNPVPDVLRMQLLGANATSPAIGLDQLPGVSNYFIGNDPSQWHTNVANYGQVEYQNVYPGVNLIYYGNQRQLEYDFDVAPGVNPDVITLRFRGQQSLALDAQGELVIHTVGGDVVEHAPVVYQLVGGARQAVSGRYVLQRADQVGFAVGAYDAGKPLTIDPVLSYSTYLGGNINDVGSGIAVDSAGNAYVTGDTSSTNFPTTAGAFQTTLGSPNYDAFVTKLNATGTALVYSTYLGGSGSDRGTAIALDSADNAYVTGSTSSTNFPTTTGAFQRTLTGTEAAFVTKLNPSGTALAYSTYLGPGSLWALGTGIALDSAGNAYVTGQTGSTNFPTTAGAFQTTSGGFQDAFVTKLNTSGTALVYSTYLGGNGTDNGSGIAVDSAGNAYVTGNTGSTNFPTTAGAFQPTNKGSLNNAGNVFITKLNASGTALVYSTYLGGSGNASGYGDNGSSIALDSAGNAYVTGGTYSSDFPTTLGAFQRTPPSTTGDGFVTKLNASGTGLVYSTYLGGSGDGNIADADGCSGIAVDSSGNASVTGFTASTNFPTTAGAFQTTIGGPYGNAFVTKLNASGSALVYSTYLGGNGAGIGDVDGGEGIAVDSSGNAYVTGFTGSTNFPTTPGAFQTGLGGTNFPINAFVAKFTFASDHFTVASATSATAGSALNITVTAQDASSNTDTSYRGTVHFTSSDPQAVLPANYSFTAADAGVHTFSVTLKTAGNQSVIATDTATSSITGTDSPINVAPASAKSLLVAGFPSPTIAGVAHTFTVTAQDPYGNTATGYTGTVHFTSTDKKAVLPLNYTFAGSDAGAHTFATTLETAGTQSITATDTVTSTITGKESGIMVSAAAANHFKVVAPASSTAGMAFSVTVEALDPYGNIATGYTGTVQFSSSDKKAVLPANYAFTGTDAGVHLFSNGVILKTAGSQTVTATDAFVTTITGKSSSIKVSAAAVDHLKIKTVASATAGTAFSVTVTAQDAFNNTVTSYLGTIHFTSSDMQALLPADYTFTATDRGVHTFSSGVILKTAGTQTVTATDKATATITGKASIKVIAAKAASLRINAPTSATHGIAFTFTVTVLDAFGNVATGYTGTVHFSSSDTAANLPANYKFTSTDAGVHTFSATLNTAGSQSLTATDTVTSTITGTESGIQVA